MKNFTKITFMIVLLAFALSGCAKKTTKTINTTTTAKNPITDTDKDGNGVEDDEESGSNSIEGCKGVYRAGATSCYIASLPNIIISGPGTIGYKYYSTADGNIGGTDPNAFLSDRVFSVRIKASRVVGGKSNSPSVRNCSNHTSTQFGKMQVDVMLRKPGQSIGSTLTFEANVDSKSGGYSSKQYFTVPGGSSDPLVLEITKVLTDHRCYLAKQNPNSPYCSSYADIPVNNLGDTECVGVKLEFATDSTYGLPN